MLELKKITVQAEAEVAIVCDKCGRRDKAEDVLEVQEYVRLTIGGGYGSRWPGDCETVHVELCQDCAKELFEQYAHE